MKKILLIFVISFIFVLNCQKKEDTNVPSPIPSVPNHLENEIRLLQMATKNNPDNIKAWIELGNLLMDNGRYHKAIDAYQRALEIDDTNADVIVDLGTCFRRIGKSDIAVKTFKKAIEINPQHKYAHRNLGVVLAFDFKDTKNAIKEFEEYIRLSSNTQDSQRIKQLIKELKSKE